MTNNQDKSLKTRKNIFFLSLLEWFLFYGTTAFFVAFIIVHKHGEMSSSEIFAWLSCASFVVIARIYKGIVNALKDHNKELVDELVITITNNNKPL